MRAIEASLVAIVSLSVTITLLIPQEKRRNAFVLVVLVSTTFVAHAMLEGLRLQMGFVYLGVVFLWIDLIVSNVGVVKTAPSPKARRGFAKTLGLVFLIITLGLLWLFPVNRMPLPSGPYKIGTASYELTDTGRAEVYGPNPGLDRRISFQVWYPADSLDGGVRTKWMTDGKEVATGIPRMYGLPSFLMNHMALIESSSYEGLKISDRAASYPVVIISHGWTGFMNLHSDLAEMLASHGYIAISINHTYGATVSVFDDGDVIYADLDALPDRDTVDDYDAYSHALVNTYALDDQLVLDFIGSYPGMSQVLEDKVDMNRIGALGHSTGGGGVVQLAINDSRVKAVFGMDAWVEPIDQAILGKGLQIPSCFLRSEQWVVGLNNQYLRQLFAQSTVEPLIFQINGSRHRELSMLYMYRPITDLLGMSGSLDSLENAAIQQDFVLTFFDHELRGKEGDVRAMEAKYGPVVGVKDFN